MPREQLDRAAVARHLNVKPDTISRYLADTTGQYNFPEPDGRIGRSPWWWSTTVNAWRKNRPGQGVGGGPKPKGKR